jgi:hypothetical protein
MTKPVEVPAGRGCDAGHPNRRCDLPPVWVISIHNRRGTNAPTTTPGVALLCAEHAATPPDKWKPQ